MPKTAAVRTHASMTWRVQTAAHAGYARKSHDSPAGCAGIAERSLDRDRRNCDGRRGSQFVAIFSFVPGVIRFDRSRFSALIFATVVSNNWAMANNVSPCLTR